jgi:hypothetical protein
MHVYACLQEFKDFLREQGSTSLGTNQDATMLGVLESASRRIDEWCGRGSGFGPRTGTNTYDGDGSDVLWLEDDLNTATPTVTVNGSTLTVDVDYYLQRTGGAYGDPPYRRIALVSMTLPVDRKMATVAGAWGYPAITRDLTITTAEALDATEQVCDVSGVTGLSPGMTLLIESEQVYVSAVTPGTTNTITIDRGVNGTTAATHDTGKTLKRIIYNAAVVDACNRVALRRWRSRDAGADGMDGGGQVGVIAPREGEDLILARTVGHLRIERVA